MQILKQSEAVRFLVSGSLNTGVSWLIYLLLLATGIPYTLAYSFAFVFGVVFTYYLNTRWVFKVPMSWQTFLQYPLVYVVQYGLGLGLMYVLVSMLGVPEKPAPLLVTILSIPVTFVLSRLILKKPAAADAR